jgi:hypothetical protein
VVPVVVAVIATIVVVICNRRKNKIEPSDGQVRSESTSYGSTLAPR